MILFDKIVFASFWGISKYEASGSETSTIAETLSYHKSNEMHKSMTVNILWHHKSPPRYHKFPKVP